MQCVCVCVCVCLCVTMSNAVCVCVCVCVCIPSFDKDKTLIKTNMVYKQCELSKEAAVWLVLD